MTTQLAGSSTSCFHVTTRYDMLGTPPSTLKFQVPIIKTNTPLAIDELGPDSPPHNPSPLLRISAPVYNTPITHHRVRPLRRPRQCRSEQDDIEEIMCFIKQISQFVSCLYNVISAVITSVFHGTIATVQWLAVVAFVIEVMMCTSASSTLSDRGSGFVGPIVGQLTSTAIATAHANAIPPPYPRIGEAAALNFLSDQIDHAHDLLTVVIGLGDDAFFEYHRTNLQRFLDRDRANSLSDGSKTEINLTVDFRSLHSNVIQSLSSYGFVGRTLSHALDEVTYHSKHTRSTLLIKRGAKRESRLDSVFLLTVSNLLLEFSSILSQTESLLSDVEVIHHQLSHHLPQVSASRRSRKAVIARRPLWGIFAGQRVDPRVIEEESVQAYITGLETVIANLRQLKAYSERITNNLSRHSFLPSASTVSTHTSQSCSSAFRNLLDRANEASNKSSSCCRCPGLKDLPTAPAMVELKIPGSSTLRTII